MQELQALLFDVDGTLANTERDGHRVAFNLAFAEAGLDWRWSIELYQDLLSVSGGKERLRYYLQKYRSSFECTQPVDDFIGRLHEAKTHHYTALLAEGAIPLRQGVERLLREARDQGYRLAIATTTTATNVSVLLTHTLGSEAESWFEVIAAGDIVAAKKPASDIYYYAMQKMALNPEHCIAFEDSENGLKAAGGAGLKTIITTNDYTREQDFRGAVIVLDSFGESQSPFHVINGDSEVIDNAVCLDMALVRRLHAA